MRSIATWCFRHRWTVILAWLVVIGALTDIHANVGSNYTDDFHLRNTQSSQAEALLARSAPSSAGDTERVVIAVPSGSVIAPAVRARVQRLFSELARLPHVSGIRSPYAPGRDGSQMIAPSDRIAFAVVNFNIDGGKVSEREAKDFTATIARASNAGVQFSVGGQVAEDAQSHNATTGLQIGFAAAAIVLFLVFGTFLAMLLPLATAAASLGAAIGIVGLLSNLVPMASFSGELSLLIGLGVGVDYALFILTRYRQGLLRGLDRCEAVAQALDTSGRAVLFAGVIVVIAMLGMLLLGVSFLYGVAIAAGVTVATTVVAALTLLPALLSLFGEGVLRRRERRAIRDRRLATTDESPGWSRWAATLERHPAAFSLAAIALLLVLAIPFASMRLGSIDAASDPVGTTTHTAYQLLAKGFGPGYNGPLELVARTGSTAARAEFERVAQVVARTTGVASISRPEFLRTRLGRPGVAVALAYPRGAPQAESTTDLLERLRGSVLPGATRGSGLHVLVGGETAVFEDFAGVLMTKLPLFVGVVTLMSFLLLMVVFRSLLVPAMAALMNLLATAAALGVVTVVFQFGWGASAIGLSTTGPIEAFLPVILFPILFGLSMDYEVFLVTRICEEWHRRGDTHEAIKHGLAATGRTITAAAAIMILVFGAFLLGGQWVISLFGVGLASAVFLDALVIRSVVVPATMMMLGDANWRLPAVLERAIPRVRIEGQTDAGPPPADLSREAIAPVAA
jgi:RND superfamily putative drug exporter